MAIDVVGLDADDTLWHSEDGFHRVERRFAELVGAHAPPGTDVAAHLAAVERRNMATYGYGAKAFTLSMVEAAIEMTDGTVPSTTLAALIEEGRALLQRPVELLDGVAETVERLRADGYTIVVITKGDLLHQHQKVQASGLGPLLHGVEVVNEKDRATYAAVLARLGVDVERFAMVGNSVKSDVLPVLGLGARAAHVPYEYLWVGEHVDHDHPHEIDVLASLRDVPTWLDGLA
jgi:putative hydrolase of the HAD superfamily